MKLGILAIVFGLVFVAELPDKTMIAVIVMSSRNRPLPVLAGASVAMVVNSAVAVAAGRLLELLPHRALEAVVTVLFAGGALYLLLTKEQHEEEEGEREAARLRAAHRVALTSFAVIVVAEIGDITQILTANLEARYRDPWAVFVGATAALVAVMSIGVAAGRVFLRVVPLAVIRKAAGVLLVGFAAYGAVTLATS